MVVVYTSDYDTKYANFIDVTDKKILKTRDGNILFKGYLVTIYTSFIIIRSFSSHSKINI